MHTVQKISGTMEQVFSTQAKLTASQEVIYIFLKQLFWIWKKKLVFTAGIAYSEEAQKFMRSVEKRLCKGPCSQKHAVTSEPIQYYERLGFHLRSYQHSMH